MRSKRAAALGLPARASARKKRRLSQLNPSMMAALEVEPCDLARPACNRALHQNIAIGLTGEAVAPGMRNGATQKKNSNCPRASQVALSTSSRRLWSSRSPM